MRIRLLRMVVIGFGTTLGLVVLILAVMLAMGPGRPPPPLESIRAPFLNLDYRDLPPLEFFPARDGQRVALRHYPASANTPAGKVVVLVHGSSASSSSMHVLAKALAEDGVATVYALDMRGHGQSGPRGDIDYLGQLDDDLADFAAWLRPRHPGEPLVLVGLSAGGGFALRVAGGRYGDRFDGYLLLSPYLNPRSPTNRPSGGWAKVSVPRIIALAILARLRLPVLQGLPVVQFAVADADRERLTPTYSFRLAANFEPHRDYLSDFARAKRPLHVLVGGADELFYPDQFAPLIHTQAPQVPVEIVPGVNHTGMITDPRALSVIADHVRRLP